MRLTFEALEALHRSLLDRLFNRQITFEAYVAEWDSVVSFAGWTWPELSDEVDAGWTTPIRRTATFVC